MVESLLGIVKCWRRNYPFLPGILFKHFTYKRCTTGSVEFTSDTLRSFLPEDLTGPDLELHIPGTSLAVDSVV